MNKSSKIVFNVENIKEDLSPEDRTARLLRLAATAALECHPTGVMEEAYFDGKGQIIEGMAPIIAYMEFKELLALELKGKNKVSTQLDKYREQGNVVLTLSTATVKDEKGKQMLSSLSRGTVSGHLDENEELARDVANILAVHSESSMKKVNNKEILITTELSEGKSKSSMMYYVPTQSIRHRFNYEGKSNVVTRDAFFSTFMVGLRSREKDKWLMNLIYIMHHFSVNSGERSYPQSQAIIDTYEKLKKNFSCFDLGPDVIPMRYDPSKFVKIKVMNLFELWSMKMNICSSLGGSKETIVSGHAWLDLPINTLKTYQEALDIVNLCYVYGFETVELEDGGVILAEILVVSGLSVICPKLSKRNQPLESVPGVYSSSVRERMYWIGLKEKPPMYKDKDIVYDEIEFLDRRNSFCYSYISPSLAKESLYPSCRASEGLVIRCQTDRNIDFKVSFPDLILRFSLSLACKSQFLYTRITFPSIDNMRKFFFRGIVIPAAPCRRKKNYVTLDDFEFSLPGESIIHSQVYDIAKGNNIPSTLLDLRVYKSEVLMENMLASVPPSQVKNLNKVISLLKDREIEECLAENFLRYLLGKGVYQPSIITYLEDSSLSHSIIIRLLIDSYLNDIFVLEKGVVKVMDYSLFSKYREMIPIENVPLEYSRLPQ